MADEWEQGEEETLVQGFRENKIGGPVDPADAIKVLRTPLVVPETERIDLDLISETKSGQYVRKVGNLHESETNVALLSVAFHQQGEE